jgi:N6-adenosine-specific RNA methylase IME4
MKTTDPQARTIICDPPYRGFGTSYSTMSLARLQDLPVGQLAADSAQLLLWCPGSLVEQAIALARSWGDFHYHQTIVWWKQRPGRPTRYFRPDTEFLLYFTRGGARARTLGVRTLIAAKSTGHSEKPLAAHLLAEKIGYPPFLELFARQKPASDQDWLIWGDEVNSDITIEGFPVPSDFIDAEAA